MKILFVNPSRAGQGFIPLNISILIGILKKEGHDVCLFDFSDYSTFDDVRKYESVFFKEAFFDHDKILRERKNFFNDSESAPVGTCLKDTDYRIDFERVLVRFRPDIIAVSSLSVDFTFIKDFLKPIKDRSGINIMIGGIHAILQPEDVLQSGVFDYVCVGEGEKSIVDLIQALEGSRDIESVKGIWFRRAGKIVKNQPMELTDLMSLPSPDYDHIDPIHFYRPFDGQRYKMLNYEFSRGCPFSCTYCVNGVLQRKYCGLGRYHRVKDPTKSIEELKYLLQRYGFNFIRFWDEDFTSINERLLAHYAAMYRKEIGLPFLIYARVDTVTEMKVKILKEMGCKTFAMGIESGSERLRREVLNRKMSNKRIIDAFNLVKSLGIRVSAYNMMGFPTETRREIFETIQINREVGADSFSVTLLEPYKGTPIREMCEKEGLDPAHETIWNDVQFVPRGMTKSELMGLFRTFPLYVRFLEDRHREIAVAEQNDGIYAKLIEEFQRMK